MQQTSGASGGQQQAAPRMEMDELLALPVSFGLRTAARAFGIGQRAAYEMAANGTFPCPIRRYGQQYRITRPDLFRALGLDPAAVTLDQVPGQQDSAAATRQEEPQGSNGLAHGVPDDPIRELCFAAIVAAAQVLADGGAAALAASRRTGTRWPHATS